MVVRGAALAWLASQAARCRMVDAPWQPEGPGGVLSQLCIDIHAFASPARQANSPGAGYAETLSRLYRFL
jgi:hypothetical protein